MPRASYGEVREETIPGVNPLDIDAGGNGGIRVRGWDRGDVLVRARVVGYATTEADARRIVSSVRVSGDIHGDTTNGGVNIELQGDAWHGAGLDVQTHNGHPADAAGTLFG